MDKIKGCAFLCDENGTVNHILRDDFKLTERIPEGELFTSFLEKHSMDQALNLMDEVKNKNVAFDYRLNINYKNQSRSLYFLGVSLNDQILFIGADNHKEAMEFTNHLHTINNEQANFIRKLLKEKTQLEIKKDKESEVLFDELTGVNNELINLQRELNKKKIELERLNDIKNKFMGIASHDLRNPLNVVQIYSEFLMDDEENLSEEQRGFAKIINDSSHFMIGLVNDLLEYSKIDSGKIQLALQEFDLKKAVKGVLSLLEPIAKKKNISIQFSADVEEARIIADFFKIEQLVNNLVGNAIKFSYLDTCIEVEVKLEGEEMLLSVSNVGDGIKPEDGKKLFRPFEKIAFKGTGNESGSGLGLFIVKQIVENHRGKIWHESILGKRTTFFVRLPLKQNS